MKLRKWLPWVILIAVLGLVIWKLESAHFDWAAFGRSFRSANLGLLALATLLIYLGNLVRAMRWAVFLRPAARQVPGARVGWTGLVGSQFIGFAGLAIFGRVGELIRPLLVARRTGLTFSSQVAVVTVERVFDLVAFGLIFALDLLLAPSLQAIPHLRNAAWFIGGATLVLGAFVLSVRLAGGAVARGLGGVAGRFSRAAGAQVTEKLLSFQQGLDVVDSAGDFGLAAGLSLALWLLVAAAYFTVLKAFPAPVHDLSAAHGIVLLGFSIAGSAIPVPAGSGAWAGNTVALGLFGIPEALATSAGLILFLVSTISVIPAGLIFARVENVSLLQLAKRSEAAEGETASAGGAV